MMNLNEWMMKFLVKDGPVAEAIAATLSAVIRRDEETLERLYRRLEKK